MRFFLILALSSGACRLTHNIPTIPLVDESHDYPVTHGFGIVQSEATQRLLEIWQRVPLNNWHRWNEP